MSLSNSQLSQLDRELDHNQREMVVISADEASALLAENNALASTQAPQVDPRTQPSMLDGLRSAIQPSYNASVHLFVNTNWGVPALFAANDIRNIRKLLQDIGGFGTKIRISTFKGREYLVLTGYPGLRRKLLGTRYGIRNAQLIQVGIGKYGIRGSSISGFKISCYAAIGIEGLEWFFNDESVMTDLFAGVGVELIKAGIASAIGYAAAVVAGTLITTAALPVVFGAIAVFAVGYGLNALDNHYGIKNSVKAGMRYAVDHIAYLHEKATQITLNDLKQYSEETATDLAAIIADEIYNEAKSWVLRKVQPGELFPSSWPQAPKLPRLLDLNLPKF
ncbi:hypothetical protein D3C77_249430 [compost metagenome]